MSAPETAPTSGDSVSALRDLLPGRVLLPGDESWDTDSLAWNRWIPQKPIAVVTARDLDDVQTLVRYAAERGLSVAPQPGGHAPTTALDGAIVLRFAGLDEVSVDVAGRRVRVGVGVKWQRVLDALDGTGLVALAGSNGSVSVVGYLAGGGMSWFGRAHGFAAHAVRSLDVVDATGEARTVTAESDPDLFWALRGGGGDFAVVTAVEMDLFPAGRIYAGAMHYWGDQTEPALRAFAEVTRDAPDELSVWIWWARYPDDEALPEPMRGRAFVSVQFTYLGAPDEAERLLAPLRSTLAEPFRDTTGELAPSALPTVSNEPNDPMLAMDWVQLVPDIDDRFLDTLVKLTGPDSGAPLIMCIRHLGGGFSRGAVATGDPAGAAGALPGRYLLLAFGVPVNPDVAAAVREHWRLIEREFADYLDGSSQYNMLGAEHDPARAFPAETLERLRALKRERDPHGVFRSNRPVLPATT